MRILHTSDWHIGRSLYRQKRYDEFEAFLSWMIDTIGNEKIDALIVAGDIFDTGTPSNRAQQLYYDFLYKVSTTCCRSVVITAGNHDSPTFLCAPKDLLNKFNIFVTGSGGEESARKDVFLLKDSEGKPGAIVCGVPYLRAQDIRTVEAGETFDDKQRKLVDGMKQHYAAACEAAKALNADNGGHLPLIATGHLFAAGGKVYGDEGVRDLYVGSLGHVGVDMFPADFSYIALGHLHVPQNVGGCEHIRYSGSPLPMGFGEANQQKKVYVVDCKTGEPVISGIDVPVFRKLVSIKGDTEHIKAEIKKLSGTAESRDAFIEVEYESKESAGNLNRLVTDALDGTELIAVKVKNPYVGNGPGPGPDGRKLEDLKAGDVFERCLDMKGIAEDAREELRKTFLEVVAAVNEADENAE